MAKTWLVCIPLVVLYAIASNTDDAIASNTDDAHICLRQKKAAMLTQKTAYGLTPDSSGAATGVDMLLADADVAMESVSDSGHRPCHYGSRLHLWPCFLVFTVAWLCALRFFLNADPQKPWYEDAAKWHFLIGVAAFFGTFAHAMAAYPRSFEVLCTGGREVLPSWLLQYWGGHVAIEEVRARLWFLSMVSLLLGEYYIEMMCFGFWLNVYPRLKQYLIALVAFGCFLQILMSGSYSSFLYVQFFTMSIGISLAMWIGEYAVAAFGAIVIVSGIIWKLQDLCILGEVYNIHYNDYRHIVLLSVQLFAHWVTMDTTYIERIYFSAQEKQLYSPRGAEHVSKGHDGLIYSPRGLRTSWEAQ